MTTYLGIRQQMFTHATEVGRSFAAFGGSCAPDVRYSYIIASGVHL